MLQKPTMPRAIRVAAAMGLMLVVPWVFATTCAQQQANQNPTANAGTDQTVAADRKSVV